MRNPQPFAEIDGAPYAAWWAQRFAAPADPLAGLRFYRRGRSNVWVGCADIEGLSVLRTDAVGMHLLRVGRRHWKPTSAAIIAFGGGATINAIDLDRHEAALFLGGEPISLSPGDPRRSALSTGFIAVRTRGAAIGCGEWHREALRSCVPKSRRARYTDE